MIISIGKKYKDSQDRVVKIISDVASLPFCYIGEVLFTGELLRYSLDGTIYGSNDINLVEELGAAQKMERIMYCRTKENANFHSLLHSEWLSSPTANHNTKFRITIEEIKE